MENRKAFLINLLYYAAIVLIIWVTFKYILRWFMPFIIGFAIAAFFNPAIRVLEKRIRIGRKAIASIVVILGYAVLVTLFTLLVLQIAALLRDLFTFLPDYVKNHIIPLLTSLDFSFDSIFSIPPELSQQLKDIQESITQSLTRFIGTLSSAGLTLVTNITKGVPAFLVSLVFTILASFFLSYQYDKAKSFILAQLSEKTRILVRAVKSTLSDTVLRYLKGYLKIMLITFAELSIGLSIIGVNNSIATALGIAIFDIFPVFGTGGILIPWAVFELLSGNMFQGLGLLVIYGIITVIRNFIEPKIIGDQLGLNPVISIISIYLGFVWIGVPGMIMMPMAVQIAIQLHRKGIVRLYKEDMTYSEPEKSEKSLKAGKTGRTGKTGKSSGSGKTAKSNDPDMESTDKNSDI